MKVLTANRLTDGEAVWYSDDAGWIEAIAAAAVAADDTATARLEAIGADAAARNLVLDVALIDVALADDRIVPLRLRERIRAAGPTIRPDLGKQARPGAARAAAE